MVGGEVFSSIVNLKTNISFQKQEAHVTGTQGWLEILLFNIDFFISSMQNDSCSHSKAQSLIFPSKMDGRICSVAAVLQRGSHLPRDNDGVSQMEHEVCVYLCVSGWKGGT